MNPQLKHIILAFGWSILLVALVVVRRECGGYLLLASRFLDHLRAVFDCLELSWIAALDEWRRMYGSCLARAKRER